jgi:hypothetical protein
MERNSERISERNKERMIIQSGENIKAVISLMIAHETNLRSHLRSNTFDFQFLLSTDISLNDVSMNSNPDSRDSRDISLNITHTTYADLEQRGETSCPITHEPFLNDDEITIINTCKHYFKKEAFLTWATHSHTCPVCRTTTRN